MDNHEPELNLWRHPVLPEERVNRWTECGFMDELEFERHVVANRKIRYLTERIKMLENNQQQQQQQ
jgi:hypothetical protein